MTSFKVFQSWRHPALAHVAVLLLMGISTVPTVAADFTWQIASSQSFRLPHAWTPSGGPPGANDRALFSNDLLVGVFFDTQQITTAALRVTNGDYTFFPIGGAEPGTPRAYTVQGAEASYVDGGTLTLGNTTMMPFVLDVDALFDVGLSGSGTLGISPASTALTTELRTRRADGLGARIGEQVGSIGAVTVNGSNALWNNTGLLIVGNAGSGRLDVLAGGQVNVTDGTSFSGHVTVGDSGSGELRVDGAGSVFSTTGLLYVGRQGGMGTLTIENGGVVNSARPDGIGARIGEQSGSVGEATVSGTHALWNNTGLLIIGNNGTGTLDVLNGGQVNITNGTTFGGQVTVGGSGSGILRVDGVGSVLSSTNSLRVGASGAGQLTITSGGLVDIAGTTTLALSAGSSGSVLLNGGTLRAGNLAAGAGQHSFDWLSGTLEVTGAAGLTIGQNQFFGEQLLLNQNSDLSVSNTLTVESGATLLTGGNLSSGSLVNDGDLALVNTTVSGPVTNAAGANITALGNVIFNDLVSGPGNFFGPGTINFNGGMAPGASPAEVEFEGSVALAETNTLFIEIGGATLGDDYDSLTIAGDATLDGVIDVSLINAFTPTVGQQFTILTANSIVNSGLMLGGSAASSFNLLVDSTSVILQAITPGDFDADGDVDGRDFLVWQRDTNVGDLADWQANYGAGAIGAISSYIAAAESMNGGASPVPEPAGLVLALIGLMASACRKLRQRF